MSTTREQLEIEQIRANIEQMRIDTALAIRKVTWYERILWAGAGAGFVILGIALAEFLRSITS